MSRLSSFANVLAQLGGKRPPVLAVLPTQPVTFPGQTGSQYQRALLALQNQQQRIQAANDRLLEGFAEQQRRQQLAMSFQGLNQLEGGLGSLARTPITVGSVGRGIAGVGGGIATVLGGAVGGPAGAAAGNALGRIGEAAADAVDGLKNFSNNLLQTNFQFAEFSPSMSRVQARWEVDMIRLSHTRGERLAASAENFRQSTQEMRETFAYLEDQLTRFANNLGASVARSPTLPKILGGAFGGILGGLELMEKYNDDEEKKFKGKNIPWLDDMSRGRMKEIYEDDTYERYGRPTRFGGNR